MKGKTIVLPRSGVVLRPWSDAVFDDWRLFDSKPAPLMLRHFRDRASFAWVNGTEFQGTWQECIDVADTAALALQAALLPPGAVVVTPADREKIALALHGLHEQTWKAWDGRFVPARGTDALLDAKMDGFAEVILAALKGATP